MPHRNCESFCHFLQCLASILGISMNIKHFRNQTDLDLSITLIINQGLASSTQTEITHTFQIKAKGNKKVEYGDIYCNYLMGISITFELDGMRLKISRLVTNEKSPLAHTLNNSSYLEINDLTLPAIESDV